MRSCAIIWLHIAIFSMCQFLIFSQDDKDSPITTTSVDYAKTWIMNALLSKENMSLGDLDRNAQRIIKVAAQDMKLREKDVKSMEKDVILLKKDVNFLEKEREDLKKAFDSEHEMKLVLQGFIDITQTIKKLFLYHWPEWTPRPKDKDSHSIDSWTTLLLNIEDPIIFRIRVLLQQHKMSIPDFVKKVMAFEIARNDEAHGELKRMDKPEAYKYLGHFAENNAGLDKKALNVLIGTFSLVGGAENVVQITSHENSSVHENVNGERTNYNVLHIAEVSSYRGTMKEARLKENFESAITFEDGSRAPLAYLITEHATGWFILFKSFEDAYYAWSNRNELLFLSLSIRNTITIRNLKDNPLWSGDIFIKVELNGTSIEEFKQKFPIHNAEEIRCAGSSSKYVLTLWYMSNEFAMLDYKKLKDIFPTKNVQFLKTFATYPNLPTIAHIKTIHVTTKHSTTPTASKVTPNDQANIRIENKDEFITPSRVLRKRLSPGISDEGVCWYHNTFGDKAKRCRKGCKFWNNSMGSRDV